MEPFEAALLRAADELRVDAFISDATWTVLAARYDESQLIDLVFGVGELTMHADFANTLGIEPEPELTDRLPAGVAYAPAARQTNSRLIGLMPRLEPLAASGPGPAGNVFRTFARNPPADELRNAQGAHIRGANRSRRAIASSSSCASVCSHVRNTSGLHIRAAGGRWA